MAELNSTDAQRLNGLLRELARTDTSEKISAHVKAEGVSNVRRAIEAEADFMEAVAAMSAADLLRLVAGDAIADLHKAARAQE